MAAETIHTLGGLLMARAARAPDQPLYTFLDAAGDALHSMSVGALAARAQGVAAGLQRQGDRGDKGDGAPILVCAPGDAHYVVALFGAFLAGRIAVPVYPPAPGDGGASLDTLAQIARASGARQILAPRALGEGLLDAWSEARHGPRPTLLALPDLDGPPPPLALTGQRPRGDGNAPAVLLYTSGSTGDPKGVVITHRAWVENLSALLKTQVPSGSARICTWLPHAHVAGLYTRLLALMGDNHAVVTPPQAFTTRPTRWLETMSRHRCTFSAAPNFAYALVAGLITDAEVSDLDLSPWVMAVSGGERVLPATVDAFFDRLAPTGLKAAALHPYYGMTETLCTAIPQGGAALRLAVSQAGVDRGRVRPPASEGDRLELVGNGPPLGAGTEVLVVQPKTRQPCLPGWIGELWTRGPGVTPGYYGDEALTREVAQCRLADGEGPWFRTGDLAVMHAGQVFITGRLKELLIVRGKNHYPTDIEATVQGAAGLLEQRCAAFTVLVDGLEALGLAVEVGEEGAGEVTTLLRSIRRAVASRHGLAIAQLYFLPEGTLPRTPSNKLARQRCRALAESGAWAHFAATVTRQAQEQKKATQGLPSLDGLSGRALRAALLPHVAQVFAAGEAGPLSDAQMATSIADLGLSSLEVARVATGLRQVAGVEPPFGALFDGSSVVDLAERLAGALEGHRGVSKEVAGWRVPARRVAHAMPDRMAPRRTREGAILLTGATGFLGSYLLAALLTQGAPEVRCLVRAADPSAAMDRIVSALKAGPGWQEGWRTRIQALRGDVTAPRFGLSPELWRRSQDEVATLVHNAANVNFVAPYSSLAPVNVAPMQTLCELAALGDALKTVHLVSTLAVFNAANRREQRVIRGIDRLLKPDFHYSGYAQSKWVAEACARAAGSRGVPLAIHRPGVITGHSASGHANVDDFLCRLIKGCIQLGAYPDAAIDLDLVTVDDVAEGIAAAVLRPVRTIDTYHWSSNPDGILLSRMMEVLCERGHPMGPEPLERWLDRVRTQLSMDNALFPVHPFLLEIPPGSDETLLEHFDGLPLNVETRESDALRAEAGLEHKRVDEGMIHRLAARLEAEGFLPAPGEEGSR